MDQLDDNFQLTDEIVSGEKKRPAFLLVLCILTFIASGFGVLTGLFSFLGFNDVESTMQNMNAGNPLADSVMNDLDMEGLVSLQRWANITGLLASVLCLTGALIMFKMRKYGFIFYVLGHAVGIYGAYLALGMMKIMTDIMPVPEMGGIMSVVGGATMVMTIIIAIAFIIMYGVNLKHLK